MTISQPVMAESVWSDKLQPPADSAPSRAAVEAGVGAVVEAGEQSSQSSRPTPHTTAAAAGGVGSGEGSTAVNDSSLIAPPRVTSRAVAKSVACSLQ